MEESSLKFVAPSVAQDLLVEFGEAFCFVFEYKHDDGQGTFRDSSRVLLGVLGKGPVSGTFRTEPTCRRLRGSCLSS